MDTELKIKRTNPMKDRCIGEFYFNDEWLYYTLEDVDRQLEIAGCDAKIMKETAIPKGRYQVIISWSNRFKRNMPEVVGVPCFTGIRIHDGGLVAEPIDTEGCPIVGYEWDTSNNTLLKSSAAFKDFFARLEEVVKNGAV